MPLVFWHLHARWTTHRQGGGDGSDAAEAVRDHRLRDGRGLGACAACGAAKGGGAPLPVVHANGHGHGNGAKAMAPADPPPPALARRPSGLLAASRPGDDGTDVEAGGPPQDEAARGGGDAGPGWLTRAAGWAAGGSPPPLPERGRHE